MGEGMPVETLFTGISRGTERLVFDGLVPPSEAERMRVPGQEGEFSFPVKYGYSAVGQVLEGEHAGHHIFTLHPHQTHFRVPESMATVLPEGLPPKRAVLGANMETAVNILWDSGASAGDTIVVIGAGVVGALTGYLAAKLPGTHVTLIDVNPERARVATALGCHFALPNDAPTDCDTVIHCSATESGLQLALKLAGQEATVVEASWFGGHTATLPLGGPFHSRRLRLVSSQVGHLPATRLPRWTHQRRIAKALELLCDDTLDVLISGETDFRDLPHHYGEILADPDTLCHRIRYETT